MTFTGRLRKLKRDVPTMTDAELLAAANDLNRTAVVLYYGAPDRVLNLCNEVLDAVDAERKRRTRPAAGVPARERGAAQGVIA